MTNWKQRENGFGTIWGTIPVYEKGYWEISQNVNEENQSLNPSLNPGSPEHRPAFNVYDFLWSLLTCFISVRWTAADVSAILLESASFITLKFSDFSIFTSAILHKLKETVWLMSLLFATCTLCTRRKGIQFRQALCCCVPHFIVTQHNTSAIRTGTANSTTSVYTIPLHSYQFARRSHKHTCHSHFVSYNLQ